MTPAGRRDQRVVIKAPGAISENSHGEPETVWSEHCKAWAKVLYGTGAERREAAIEGADQTATFIVVRNSNIDAVGTKYRLFFNGADWDIESIAKVSRAEAHITAKRRAA